MGLGAGRWNERSLCSSSDVSSFSRSLIKVQLQVKLKHDNVAASSTPPPSYSQQGIRLPSKKLRRAGELKQSRWNRSRAIRKLRQGLGRAS